MRLKDVMNNMFGFIITQPIYKTLRQMRVIQVTLLSVSIHIMYRLVDILEKAGTLSPAEALGAGGVLLGTLFATVWKAVSDLNKPYKSDD